MGNEWVGENMFVVYCVSFRTLTRTCVGVNADHVKCVCVCVLLESEREERERAKQCQRDP